MVKTPKKPKTPKRKTEEKPKQQQQQEEGVEQNKENDAKRPRQSQIVSFFQRVEKPAPPPTLPPSILNSRFKPFQLKEGMRMAPPYARKPLTTEQLENLMNIDVETSDFLALCKLKRKKRPASNMEALKAKLFHFHDNYRPPYFGTWRRRSAHIKGRHPLNRQEQTLNYDEDSDEEWEAEPQDADECKSDEEEIEKDDEEEEENDGFFVDHGYLSTGEGSDDDEEDGQVEAGQQKGEAQTAGEGEPRSKPISDEDIEERRMRLEQKAREWHEHLRQKERRARKREKPILYMPDPNAQSVPFYHRCCRPGVRFDYTQIQVETTEMEMETASHEAKQLGAMQVSEEGCDPGLPSTSTVTTS